MIWRFSYWCSQHDIASSDSHPSTHPETYIYFLQLVFFTYSLQTCIVYILVHKTFFCYPKADFATCCSICYRWKKLISSPAKSFLPPILCITHIKLHVMIYESNYIVIRPFWFIIYFFIWLLICIMICGFKSRIWKLQYNIFVFVCGFSDTCILLDQNHEYRLYISSFAEVYKTSESLWDTSSVVSSAKEMIGES